MRIIEAKNYHDLSKKAAEIIIRQVQTKPDTVLGMATGGTVLETYANLVRDHQENKTSYEHVHTVNLDEYVGMKQSDPNSYHYYMKKHLFSHIDIKDNHVHIPNGVMEDLDQECVEYEKTIKKLGGVDLQLLGIGGNGHIGFNEPGTTFDSTTHVVTLTDSTREANKRFFNSLEEVPTHAITMGIATIMRSKQILLVVSGVKKAYILKELLNDKITEEIPATVLKMHPNVTVIADKDALSLLQEEFKRELVQ